MGFGVGGIACVMAAWKMSNHHTMTKKQKTVVDVYNEHEALKLVTMLSRDDDDMDVLADRMFRILMSFPPSERQLRSVSLRQQSLQGSGNAHEFAITLVCSISMLVVCDNGGRLSPIKVTTP